jgi:hypothetical protein
MDEVQKEQLSRIRKEMRGARRLKSEAATECDRGIDGKIVAC